MGAEGFLADRYYKQAIHGSPGVWYGSFEFVALNLNPDHAPALVVTGNQAPSATPPFFTVSNLRTIYGGELPYDTMYGGRVMMGFWFNRNQTWGLFGSYFTTNTSANSFQAASFDGTRFLARPFYDTNPALELPLFSPDREQLERVSDLGGQGGSVTINRNHMLRSANLNFRFNLWNNYPTCSRWNWHVDSYVGVKYMGLDESLSIREDLRAYADILGFPFTPGGYTLLFPAGTEITVIDEFRTRNNFIGANLGLMNEVRLGRIFMELRAGIALGTTYSEVVINGSTQYRLPNLPPTPVQNGGLLALPTNIGTYRSSAFSYIPEFGVKLGLQMTDHLRVYAGYDLAFWSNVVRPGQQIDRHVNTSQLPLVNPQTAAVVPNPLNGPA
ncbi:MAG TPA: BBP7 family outer membrane beta-barrel protein, partial [Gemmatales bacterium]|nr:BBP7 family outer membrane beta-barrel protein [Gemmatales bacterium]